MGIEEFLDLMSDTVDFYARTGKDGQGKAIYAATPSNSRPIPCRIEMKNRLIVVHQGGEVREALARGRVILGSSFKPGIEDKIVLPADYVPISPPILAVNIVPDESGDHHTTVEIG